MKKGTMIIINKEKLQELIIKWLKEYKIFAPVKKENLLLFSEINAADEVILNSVNTKNTPKNIFLPQSEPLFTYDSSSQVRVEEIWDGEENKILLGVRPCDAKAIKLLDKVFSTSQYQDIYFNKRHKNSIIIGLACLFPQNNCFCTSVGGGPFSKEASDIFLIEVKEGYLLEVLTEKGERLIGSQKNLKVNEEKLKLVEKLAAQVRRKMKLLPIQDISEKLKGMFEDSLWEKISQRCLGCGVCTYLCPTCYCFDIQDIPLSHCQGKRIRSWDSCMFSLFTLQASGHNPRSSLKKRLRQRVMHKFSYFSQNYGTLGCVGCGRCLDNCPAGVDIREIIQQIMAAKVGEQ